MIKITGKEIEEIIEICNTIARQPAYSLEEKNFLRKATNQIKKIIQKKEQDIYD